MYVYLIGNKALGHVKIGTSADPESRMAELQPGSSVKLKILAKIPGDRRKEWNLHIAFREWRLCGEWFEVTDSNLEMFKEYFGVDLTTWFAARSAPTIVVRKLLRGKYRKSREVTPDDLIAAHRKLSPLEAVMRQTAVNTKNRH